MIRFLTQEAAFPWDTINSWSAQILYFRMSNITFFFLSWIIKAVLERKHLWNAEAIRSTTLLSLCFHAVIWWAHTTFLVGPHRTGSKVVITVKLLPWLQYLEDDSQRAICKNWLGDKFNTDPWSFDGMSCEARWHFPFSSPLAILITFRFITVRMLNYKQNAVIKTNVCCATNIIKGAVCKMWPFSLKHKE